MIFDFLSRTSCTCAIERQNRMKVVKLESKSVADFYAETMGVLAELGIAVKIWPMPVEIPSPIRFN